MKKNPCLSRVVRLAIVTPSRQQTLPYDAAPTRCGFSGRENVRGQCISHCKFDGEPSNVKQTRVSHHLSISTSIRSHELWKTSLWCVVRFVITAHAVRLIGFCIIKSLTAALWKYRGRLSFVSLTETELPCSTPSIHHVPSLLTTGTKPLALGR